MAASVVVVVGPVVTGIWVPSAIVKAADSEEVAAAEDVVCVVVVIRLKVPLSLSLFLL